MKIKVSDKKKDKYKLIFDNNEEMQVSEELVLKYRLLPGNEISDEEYCDLIQDKEYDDCYQVGLKNILASFKSRFNLYLFLKNKGFKNDCINCALDHLEDIKLLSDEKFAFLKANGLLCKAYGPFYIKAYLTNNGIKEELYDKWRIGVSDETFLDYAKILLIKQKKNYQKLSKEDERRQLISFFERRGFEYSFIKKILE